VSLNPSRSKDYNNLGLSKLISYLLNNQLSGCLPHEIGLLTSTLALIS
jgi:hypothetical protein